MTSSRAPKAQTLSKLRINRAKWYARIGYTPRESQCRLEQAVEAGHRYLAFFAFPRAGKSYGAAKFAEPYLLEPDRHVWIVAPTYELGSKEFGYIWNDMLETGFLRQASTRNYDIRGGNMRIAWPWGSFVKVVSADNQVALRAEELDVLILAEASELPPDVFERHLFARVEKRKGLVVVPTTPHGYNWIYDRFRLPSLPEGHPELQGKPNPAYDPLCWSVVVSADPDYGDLYEPNVYDAEYIARAKKTLPPQFYKEQVGGSFASYAGLIYQYEPERHRCAPFEIPDWWTHIVGWDHGSNAPTAILLGSISPDAHIYWWGEVYEAGLSVAEYAAKLQRLMGSKARSILGIDPSAKQVRIELMKVGICTHTARDKHIDARITKINELLSLNRFHVFEGRCPNLEKELFTWEWDDATPGKPRPRQACHALDAVGYALLCDAQPPMSDERDPDDIPGESPEISALWKGFRKDLREREELASVSTMARILMPDPFEEMGHSEDYVLEAS